MRRRKFAKSQITEWVNNAVNTIAARPSCQRCAIYWRERLAQWMIHASLATGHGDAFDDLLHELTWQIAELRRHAQTGL